jgi:hypothetical protein
MWIRSQDKLMLVNCNIIECDKNEIGGLANDTDVEEGTMWILGKYKTKKRCLEVLDEIEGRLNSTVMDEITGLNANKLVYQMPEK